MSACLLISQSLLKKTVIRFIFNVTVLVTLKVNSFSCSHSVLHNLLWTGEKRMKIDKWKNVEGERGFENRNSGGEAGKE